MTITINGIEQQFPETELRLTQLLVQLKQEDQPLLIEHNGVALHPQDQETLLLKDGDKLELLRMVAGG